MQDVSERFKGLASALRDLLVSDKGKQVGAYDVVPDASIEASMIVKLMLASFGVNDDVTCELPVIELAKTKVRKFPMCPKS